MRGGVSAVPFPPGRLLDSAGKEPDQLAVDPAETKGPTQPHDVVPQLVAPQLAQGAVGLAAPSPSHPAATGRGRRGTPYIPEKPLL